MVMTSALVLLIANVFHAAPAEAAATGSGAPTNVCRSMKLQAAGHYFLCLVRAGADQARRGSCNLQFARAFERADRISSGCGTDSLDRLRDLVYGFEQGLLTSEASPPACAAVTANGDKVTCWLVLPPTESNTVTTLSSVNLQSVINQVQLVPQSQCAPCASVTGDTVLWLQAWGADNFGINKQAYGGFAQTVTTINDLMGRGIQTLHFYLGAQGSSPGGSEAGGETGAASTIVTGQDLTLTPAQQPDFNQVLLIAGGAGGTGGCDSECMAGCLSPGAGGDGGVAIATTLEAGSGQGQKGGDSGGFGGHDGIGGSGVYNGKGLDGVGGRGGISGEGDGGNGGVAFNPEWYNTGATNLTFTSGQGQGGGNDTSLCADGGGGGGGGWGGGGGGYYGNENGAPGGGGGGGSYAIQSTKSDGNAPTTRQNKPGSTSYRDGFIQLVFDTNPS